MTLFDTPRNSPKVAANARTTSRDAAARLAPKAGTQRRTVYDAIARYCDPRKIIGDTWGLTDEQIADVTGLGLNSVRPRRLELVEGGYVKKGGERPGLRSTNKMTVWVTTGKAVDG